eukprot:109329-Pyramimonas_sp.AAC.1
MVRRLRWRLNRWRSRLGGNFSRSTRGRRPRGRGPAGGPRGRRFVGPLLLCRGLSEVGEILFIDREWSAGRLSRRLLFVPFGRLLLLQSVLLNQCN